mmetsp:Transcript_38492/g.84589  ORF Transcript_38492/g.84589 Transcript_38492/m.84589 type:complete len:210 (+) Transcript_38492:211-840(+)
MLLDRNVGQVDQVIVQFIGLVRVVDGREARESAPVDVDFERTVPDDENVEAQVELLAADEEGVGDVARAHVRVLWGGGVHALRDPALDLRQPVDDEDADSLRFGGGLHDPHGVGRATELLGQESVICRQNEGGRDTLEVKVEIVPLISVAVTRVSLIRVACGVSLIRVGDSALGRDALELLAVAFQVFDHKVLARELEVVRKVIDHLAV